MNPLLKFYILSFIALLSFVGISTSAFADPQIATIPGARANMSVLAPRSFQSKAFSYKHQVTVALPASYAAEPERAYPVLWVLDSPLIMRSVVGLLDVLVLGNLAPEMIVVCVGTDPGFPPQSRCVPELASGSDPPEIGSRVPLLRRACATRTFRWRHVCGL